MRNPRNRRLTRRFWVALATTLTPFVATPLVVNALTREQELRDLAVGAASALTLVTLAVAFLVIGLVSRIRNRQIGLGILVGLAIGIVVGGVGCFAVMAQV